MQLAPLFSLERVRGGCGIPQSWAWDGPIAQFRLERTPDKREVVGSIPTRPTTVETRAEISSISGGVAQLGEHLLCTQEVIGSIPFTSTTFSLPLAL